MTDREDKVPEGTKVILNDVPTNTISKSRDQIKILMELVNGMDIVSSIQQALTLFTIATCRKILFPNRMYYTAFGRRMSVTTYDNFKWKYFRGITSAAAQISPHMLEDIVRNTRCDASDEVVRTTPRLAHLEAAAMGYGVQNPRTSLYFLALLSEIQLWMVKSVMTPNVTCAVFGHPETEKTPRRDSNYKGVLGAWIESPLNSDQDWAVLLSTTCYHNVPLLPIAYESGRIAALSDEGQFAPKPVQTPMLLYPKITGDTRLIGGRTETVVYSVPPDTKPVTQPLYTGFASDPSESGASMLCEIETTRGVVQEFEPQRIVLCESARGDGCSVVVPENISAMVERFTSDTGLNHATSVNKLVASFVIALLSGSNWNAVRHKLFNEVEQGDAARASLCGVAPSDLWWLISNVIFRSEVEIPRPTAREAHEIYSEIFPVRVKRTMSAPPPIEKFVDVMRLIAFIFFDTDTWQQRWHDMGWNLNSVVSDSINSVVKRHGKYYNTTLRATAISCTIAVLCPEITQQPITF